MSRLDRPYHSLPLGFDPGRLGVDAKRGHQKHMAGLITGTILFYLFHSHGVPLGWTLYSFASVSTILPFYCLILTPPDNEICLDKQHCSLSKYEDLIPHAAKHFLQWG